jgi:hypothetical protein
MAVGSASLSCGFFVLPYRTPAKIDLQYTRDPDRTQFLDQDSGAGEANPDRIYVPSTTGFSIGDQVWVLDNDTPRGELATIQNISTNNYLEVNANLKYNYATAQNALVSVVSDTVRSWGGILCIDPNGLREDQKGPIFFLLDTFVMRPGLTDKAGAFTATINDGKTSLVPLGAGTVRNRRFDRMLFQEGTPFIRDNDEFWMGVQQGPEAPNTPQGLSNSWTPTGGGRYWLMGGWVCRRSYERTERGRINAKIEGQCYMDLWKENFFGTPDTPRDYTHGADFAQVAADVLSDVNAGQETDYEFRGDASYFPASMVRIDVAYGATVVAIEAVGRLTTGSAFIWDDDTPEGETVTITNVDPNLLQVTLSGAGIQNIPGYSASTGKIMMVADFTGHQINKEFKEEAAFSVMQDGCEQTIWEWQIVPNPTGATAADRRAVMLYARDSGPISDQPYIEFTRNIRHVPSLMMGDTSGLITDVIITGEQNMIPPNPMAWIESGLWPDINWVSRRHTMLSVPPPPNSRTGSYSDGLQVMDDEGWPGICFMRTDVGSGQFWIYLSFYTDETGNPVAGNMDIDLRKWRRLRYKFKHNSRADPDTGTVYQIWMHTLKGSGVNRFNNKYEYTFGKGDGTPGDAIFTGTGLDDATSGGQYTDTETSYFTVEIDGIGPPDTFRWRKGTGAWTAGVTITGAAQTLADGITVNFGAVGGHTLGDEWRIDVSISPQLLADVTDNDTIEDDGWSKIDLLLPEINPDKTVFDLQGWREVGSPDPDQIDFISFKINCAEEEPGKSGNWDPWSNGTMPPAIRDKRFVNRVALQQNVSVGDYYIRIPNPNTYFGWSSAGAPATLSGETVFYNPKPICILGDTVGNSHEFVEIDAINGEYPSNNNVRLRFPVQNAYTGSNKYLYIIGGWSFSFSQLRFERNVLFEKESTLPAHLQNPRRYKVVDYSEIEYSSEAEARADQELLQLGIVTQFAKPLIDGDPRQRIGYRVITRFDPERSAAGEPNPIFHDIYMLIDDAQYVVAGVDFYAVYTLGTMSSRGRELNEAVVMSRQEKKIHRTARGTIPLGRGILQVR